jgi:hypothetical protein
MLVVAGAAQASPTTPLLDVAGTGISSRGLPFEPTLAAIQANVFTPSCALSFCHGDAQTANLHLSDGAAYASLVGVASVEVPTALRVEPFAPDESYLVCKLEHCAGVVGSQMPLIGGPLDPTFIEVIRTWILMGAPETPPVSVEDQTCGRVKSFYRD